MQCQNITTISLCHFCFCCRRTKPFTAVTLANVVSVVFAAPLAAGLMALDGRGGLKGWQVCY
jgi:hypothetical protein